MYKNGRPARVVMTDAGLNDYINDISFLPGFDFRREGEEIALLYFIFSRVFLATGFRGISSASGLLALAGLFRVGGFLGIIIPVILPLFGRCLLRLTLSVSVTEISRNMVQ